MKKFIKIIATIILVIVAPLLIWAWEKING